VAEQLAAIGDAGVHHVLCQMSFGYLRSRPSSTRCGGSARP